MDFSQFDRCVIAPDESGISDDALRSALEKTLSGVRGEAKKVLLLPPDQTRFFSYAGRITNICYHLLCECCTVDIMPALGTHVAMTDAQLARMFGDIPKERFLVHHWRRDVVPIGTVPAAFVREVSEGRMDAEISVEVNRRIVSGAYDLILSIGQVVPHEVVGMANFNKNIFVGCGGASMINASHMLGAVFGMERIMGRDQTPVRKVFDYAAAHFLGGVPLVYLLTVTTQRGDEAVLHGLFCGRERTVFERAVQLSEEKNLTFLDAPLSKVVVSLDEAEFQSTWLGNKSIYRTRMAIADGGELFVLAPGVERFGEDPEIDRLIRAYGYVGREEILRLCEKHADLRDNLSAAAHLIHGSSNGRFSITYCTRALSKDEVEGVGFSYLPYEEAARRFAPEALRDGFNRTAAGEDVFYISNPALGLWADRARFYEKERPQTSAIS